MGSVSSRTPPYVSQLVVAGAFLTLCMYRYPYLWLKSGETREQWMFDLVRTIDTNIQLNKNWFSVMYTVTQERAEVQASISICWRTWASLSLDVSRYTVCAQKNKASFMAFIWITSKNVLSR